MVLRPVRQSSLDAIFFKYGIGIGLCIVGVARQFRPVAPQGSTGTGRAPRADGGGGGNEGVVAQGDGEGVVLARLQCGEVLGVGELHLGELQRVGARGLRAVAVGVGVHGDGELLRAVELRAARDGGKGSVICGGVRSCGGHNGREGVALFAIVIASTIGRHHAIKGKVGILRATGRRAQGDAVGVDGLVAGQGFDFGLQVKMKYLARRFVLGGVYQDRRCLRQRDGGRYLVARYVHGLTVLVLHDDGHLGIASLHRIVQHRLAGGGIGREACPSPEVVNSAIVGIQHRPSAHGAAVALGEVEVLQHQRGERLGVGEGVEGACATSLPIVIIARARQVHDEGHIHVGVNLVQGVVSGGRLVALGACSCTLFSVICNLGLDAHACLSRQERQRIVGRVHGRGDFVVGARRNQEYRAQRTEYRCLADFRACHPERSEGSRVRQADVPEILRSAQNDTAYNIVLAFHIVHDFIR